MQWNDWVSLSAAVLTPAAVYLALAQLRAARTGSKRYGLQLHWDASVVMNGEKFFTFDLVAGGPDPYHQLRVDLVSDEWYENLVPAQPEFSHDDGKLHFEAQAPRDTLDRSDVVITWVVGAPRSSGLIEELLRFNLGSNRSFRWKRRLMESYIGRWNDLVAKHFGDDSFLISRCGRWSRIRGRHIRRRSHPAWPGAMPSRRAR